VVGSEPLPKFRERRIIAAVKSLLAALTLTTMLTYAQSADISVPFEVASIKRSIAPDARGSMGSQPGGRFVMVNGTVQSLITFAYNLPLDDLTVGAPGWTRSERYNVNAKAPNPAPTFDELRLMVRALLRDRFQFQARQTRQPHSAYALVFAHADGRLGPKIQKAQVDCNELRAQIASGKAPPLRPPPSTGPAPPCTIRSRPASLNSGGISMSTLASVLTRIVGRPVIDNTSLTGDFTFELEFEPTGFGFSVSEPGEPSGLPSIFTGLEEQLGLKLDSMRAPVDVLVVERIEHPTSD
jgi:uncharacterized protein (TIGR03435 family)